MSARDPGPTVMVADASKRGKQPSSKTLEGGEDRACWVQGSLSTHPLQVLLLSDARCFSKWTQEWSLGGAMEQPMSTHGNKGIPVSLLHHQKTVLEDPLGRDR